MKYENFNFIAFSLPEKIIKNLNFLLKSSFFLFLICLMQMLVWHFESEEKLF